MGENWIAAGVPVRRDASPSFCSQPAAPGFGHGKDGEKPWGKAGPRGLLSLFVSLPELWVRTRQGGVVQGADQVGSWREEGKPGYCSGSGLPSAWFASGLLFPAALPSHREPLPGMGCEQCPPYLPGEVPGRVPANTHQTEGLGGRGCPSSNTNEHSVFSLIQGGSYDSGAGATFFFLIWFRFT